MALLAFFCEKRLECCEDPLPDAPNACPPWFMTFAEIEQQETRITELYDEIRGAWGALAPQNSIVEFFGPNRSRLNELLANAPYNRLAIHARGPRGDTCYGLLIECERLRLEW